MNMSPPSGVAIAKCILWLLVVAVCNGMPVSARASSITINPTFSGMNGGLSLSAQNIIDSAIKFYEGILTNPITVNIEFYNMSGGLGSSFFVFYSVPYTTYRSALVADQSSADDATALASLPVTAPIGTTGDVGVKSSDGRALGLNTPEITFGATTPCGQTFTGSGCIGLNVSNTTTDGGIYSLFATTEHEIDEILGLGSALHGVTTPATPWAEDLFRYTAAGVRSYAANACGSQPNAYFSIDGGTTNLVNFNNCDNGGDYGDWVTHTPSQVQDAFTNGTGNPSLTATSPEVRALDVIGYNLAQVPEPATVLLLGIGIVAIFILRLRHNSASSPSRSLQADFLPRITARTRLHPRPQKSD